MGWARLLWGAGVSSPSETWREPGPPPLSLNSVPQGAPEGPRHTESYAGRRGYGARVPPRPPLEAPAPGRGVPRCWPDAGSPSGRGTPDRVLGVGQGLGVRVWRFRLDSLTPRASTRWPRRSPRVSSGAASTSSCEEIASAGAPQQPPASGQPVPAPAAARAAAGTRVPTPAGAPARPAADPWRASPARPLLSARASPAARTPQTGSQRGLGAAGAGRRS